MILMARAPHIREVHSDPASIDVILPGHIEDPNEVHVQHFSKKPTNVYEYKAASGVHKTIAQLKNDEYRGRNVMRTISAQSLPIAKTDLELGGSTPYEKEVYLLKHDVMVQKDVTLGRRIGFYKVGKELGSGNFSKVKLGIHVLTREKVAIKIMERSRMDQKARHLLNREIQAMEELHHPNIIRLFECIETMSRTFLVMEYAGGGELYAYIRERVKLTEEDCKPLFSQIVAAVAHMHALNIVHRDIKAENVIFSRPGLLKLGDFGFSCKLENHGKLHTFCGSPPYAAPELFKDEEYYGPMVDVWALGVLLYFMLVGNTPFRGETISDLRQSIMKGFFELPDYLSSFAQLIITRMLELNPEKRMTVFDIKKTFWLKDTRFAQSYVYYKIPSDKEEHQKNTGSLEKNTLCMEVWNSLTQYGITEEMLKEAYPKGPHNTIVGMYRIISYQAQLKSEEERQRLQEARREQMIEATKGKQTPKPINRSKTCSLF